MPVRQVETTFEWIFPNCDIFSLQLAKDLLHPRPEEEKRKHKLKRLVQHPNSYFMDVKCPGCYKITTVFSHAQTVVLCVGCSTVLCQPTGGRARLTEGKECYRTAFYFMCQISANRTQNGLAMLKKKAAREIVVTK